MSEEGNIIVRGAKVNNLKNVTVEIPRGKFVVITGISGSGKSSLAFDTLFAEGQRRFAESLSSYARQFLGRMSKPDVELIERYVKELNTPVIAEGGIWVPEDLKNVYKAGAFSAVCGTAITRPMDITKRFVKALEDK